jgi:hypothetical protein
VSFGGVSIGVQGYGGSARTQIYLTQRPDSTNAADERGLGVSLTSPTPSDTDLKINAGEYVLLDNNIAVGLGYTPTGITVGSLQAGESALMCGYTGADGSIALPSLHLLATLTGGATLQSLDLTAFPEYGA